MHTVPASARKDHYEIRTRQSRPRQIQTRDEAGKEEHEHHTTNGKQAAVERGNGVRFSFDRRFLQNLSKPRSQDYEVAHPTSAFTRREKCKIMRVFPTSHAADWPPDFRRRQPQLIPERPD